MIRTRCGGEALLLYVCWQAPSPPCGVPVASSCVHTNDKRLFRCLLPLDTLVHERTRPS